MFGYCKQAEEERATSEDAARSRAFGQAIKELKASNVSRREDIKAQLRRERFEGCS